MKKEVNVKREALIGIVLCLLPILFSTIIHTYFWNKLQYDYLKCIEYVLTIICILIAVFGSMKKLGFKFEITSKNFFKDIFKEGLIFWIYIAVTFIMNTFLNIYYWGGFKATIIEAIINSFISEIVLRGLLFVFFTKYLEHRRNNILEAIFLTSFLYYGLDFCSNIHMYHINIFKLKYSIYEGVFYQIWSRELIYSISAFALCVIYYKTKNISVSFGLNLIFNILYMNLYFFNTDFFSQFFKNNFSLEIPYHLLYFIEPLLCLPILIFSLYQFKKIKEKA